MITGSFETKSNVSGSFEGKPTDLTWGGATWTWEEETGKWAAPTRVGSKESKNNVSGTFETKN